jgi:hypothetical protein
MILKLLYNRKRRRGQSTIKNTFWILKKKLSNT